MQISLLEQNPVDYMLDHMPKRPDTIKIHTRDTEQKIIRGMSPSDLDDEFSRKPEHTY